MTPVKRADFAFFYPMAVRWGDMDALGHVNNAKFFTYDESVRLEYFRKLMQDDPKFWVDYGLILAHIEADFLSQLKPPATLDLGFRIAKLGRTSLRTEAGMFLGDTCVAITRAVIVWYDYKKSQALPIPDDVRAKIRKLEVTAPEEG